MGFPTSDRRRGRGAALLILAVALLLATLGCTAPQPNAEDGAPPGAVTSPTSIADVLETPEPTPAPATVTPIPPDTPTPVPTPTLIAPPGATSTVTAGTTSPSVASAGSTPGTPPTSGAATAGPAVLGTPATAATAPATPAPERVRVAGVVQGANLRREPGTSGAVLGTLRNGTELVVVGPDRAAEGQAWRNVRAVDGDEGWIVAAAVETIATPVPTVTPAALTPTATGTLTSGVGTPTPSSGTPVVAATAGAPGAPATPDATEPPVAVVTATPTSTATRDTPPSPTQAPSATTAPPSPPERARIAAGSQGANLRAEPGTGGQLVKPLREGAELTVIGPNREVAGQVWRNVRDVAGDEGWVVGEAVTSLSSSTTPIPAPAGAPAATPAPGAPPDQSGGVTPPGAASDSGEGAPEAAPTMEDPATPCRAGQIKGDAASGLYYLPDHPEYVAIRERVRCFDVEGRATASGFLAAP